MSLLTSTKSNKKTSPSKKDILRAYELMCTSRRMADIYDENRQICSYVHSTSKGHEAIQLALAFNLKNYDWVSPYYRDESILLGVGFTPYELMLQLLAKADDPFSGGRSYYAHPSSLDEDKPKMIHQSSATGMQAIPTTGIAQGIAYLESQGLHKSKNKPVVVCSLGDGSVTEGEVSEAFQYAALHQLPIIYLVQDNEWGISVSSDEARSMDAYEYIAGFKGIKRTRVDGSDFVKSYEKMAEVVKYVRNTRKPILVHAQVPLLGHHTSGVRKEWYRTEEDLAKHEKDDPFDRLERHIKSNRIFSDKKITDTQKLAAEIADKAFQKAVKAKDPEESTILEHVYAPTPVTEETGERHPEGREKVVMVDAALHAMEEILRKHPEALFYGQDVGGRLGGVFREAATLAQKFGDDRVFNTAIQEAYIVGSTAGMSAVGCKPMVEIQFADYIWPSINQLITELSKSCYLSMGKFPIQSLIRIPIGAYGGGGPYHSGSIESAIVNVKGIKVCMPSNAADLKGLLKAAFYDPNPVIMFEHKGLYWSKVQGTEAAKTVEPDEDYIVPLGKGRIALNASEEAIENGESVVVVTYGMGVHWALNASKNFNNQIEIIDLRTLNPIDHELIFSSVEKHNKCLVLTEEQLENSFAEALAGRISQQCFQSLDAPVKTIGSLNSCAVPLNKSMEQVMLPGVEKLTIALQELLQF